ncbi:FAD binding domain-containing protein [Dermatobacter hominis]|uniref:FAD binding domain-containing protein n=1 Tax=Dermatobacter hominis TaxID=2884263 RepID=UPI001D12C747|nr:FAD binding domain-containing protein [Dermatobacter hominis]UDY35473.1 FAD binding domain-containing protein [Dermatobacter hominis]
MKPPPFDYVDPDSVEGVVAALAEDPGAVLIAGGQSLVMALNLRQLAPTTLVDLRRVPGLGGIRAEAGAVVAGATATAADLLTHPTTAGHGALRRAVRSVGHPQTRTRTTVGGTIALAEPVAEVPTTLVALGGSVTVTGPTGTRTIAADDWITGPYTTARARDEVVVEVRFDVPAGPSTWREFVRRRGTFPIAGACVALEHLDGDPTAEVTGARIGLCGAAATPVRSSEAEAALVGAPLDEAAVGRAVAAVLDTVTPPPHPHATSDHRRALAGATLRIALGDLLVGPGGSAAPGIAA